MRGASRTNVGIAPRNASADESVSHVGSQGDLRWLDASGLRFAHGAGSLGFLRGSLPKRPDAAGPPGGSSCAPSPQVGADPAARRMRTGLRVNVKATRRGSSTLDPEDGELCDLHAKQPARSPDAQLPQVPPSRDLESAAINPMEGWPVRHILRPMGEPIRRPHNPIPRPTLDGVPPNHVIGMPGIRRRWRWLLVVRRVPTSGSSQCRTVVRIRKLPLRPDPLKCGE